MLSEVQVAEHLAADADGNPDEAVHSRVVARKADRARVVADVLQPDRARIVDEGSEHAAATRGRADRFDGLGTQPDVDEFLEHPVGSDHTEGTVLRADELNGRFDNAAQHRRELQLAHDSGVRRQETAQPCLDISHPVTPFSSLGSLARILSRDLRPCAGNLASRMLEQTGGADGCETHCTTRTWACPRAAR